MTDTISITSHGKSMTAELYTPAGTTTNSGVIIIAYGSDGLTDDLTRPWATMIRGFAAPTAVPLDCLSAAADAHGLPIIQGDADPKPGYFVSTTELHQPGENVRTPQAQLDSNSIPFAVIPSIWQSTRNPGPRLGDFGVAYRRSTGRMAFFVIGDIGPRNRLGKGSVALHQVLANSDLNFTHPL